MCAGRLVELAPCEELFRNPVHPYTQALLAAVPEPDLDAQARFRRADGRQGLRPGRLARAVPARRPRTRGDDRRSAPVTWCAPHEDADISERRVMTTKAVCARRSSPALLACAAVRSPARRRTFDRDPDARGRGQGGQAAAGGQAPAGDSAGGEPATPGAQPGQHGGSLNMLIGRSRDVRMLVVYGYARLVGYDENFNIVPDILESVEVEDDRIFTLKLRKGHRWSDGQPFTIEDFRYFWEDVANNKELSPTGPAERPAASTARRPRSSSSTSRPCATAGRSRIPISCRAWPARRRCSSSARRTTSSSSTASTTRRSPRPRRAARPSAAGRRCTTARTTCTSSTTRTCRRCSPG